MRAVKRRPVRDRVGAVAAEGFVEDEGEAGLGGDSGEVLGWFGRRRGGGAFWGLLLLLLLVELMFDGLELG